MSTVLSTADISDLMNRFKPLNVAEMPSTVVTGETFKHPVIDQQWRERPLPRGRVQRYQLTIAEANEGKYYYMYLDGLDLERYNGAFRIVTKDCEAAVADGARIPDSYFNAQGAIYNNGQIYCYCTWKYHMSHCQNSERRGARTLASFMPGEREAAKDASGKTVASVHNKGLSSKLVEIGDADKTNNAKKKGN